MLFRFTYIDNSKGMIVRKGDWDIIWGRLFLYSQRLKEGCKYVFYSTRVSPLWGQEFSFVIVAQSRCSINTRISEF